MPTSLLATAILSFGLLLVLAPSAKADVCRWVGPDGRTQYSDRSHAPADATCTSAQTKPKPVSASPNAVPSISTAEADYLHRRAVDLIGSSDPREQARGRELGDALDRHRAAQEEVDRARAERTAVEREFSDLHR